MHPHSLGLPARLVPARRLTAVVNARPSSRLVSSSTLPLPSRPARRRVGQIRRVAEQPRPRTMNSAAADRPRQALERLEAARAGQAGRPVAQARHRADRRQRANAIADVVAASSARLLPAAARAPSPAARSRSRGPRPATPAAAG